MPEHIETKTEQIKWYAASAIIVTRLKDAPDECPLIEERVYLIRAPDDDNACEKANAFAKQEEEAEFQFEYDGRPAREQFMGIRKLITIRSHVNDTRLHADEPRDGSELTFSYFQLQDKNDLQALVDGDPVRILYKGDPVRTGS